MDVSITQFRRDLFELVNQALKGEPVAVIHKGHRLLIVPEGQSGSRFSKLTRLQVVNPEVGRGDEALLKEEMAKAWEKDWADL